jgi:hypothetical protein
MYQPIEIFAEILRVIYPKKFGGNLIATHKIFYDLRNKFPEIMSGFRFLIKINPYCVTLDELITKFQLAGVLQILNPDLWSFKINSDKLNEFPTNYELLDSFKKMSELQGLCV